MTGILEWREEYALGIEEVDHEHRELIDLINALYELVQYGSGNGEVETFLAEVHARIAAHFALEEARMRRLSYPEYASHKADHERLLDDLLDIMDAAAAGDFEPDALGARLDAWFGVHFRTHDARLHALHG